MYCICMIVIFLIVIFSQINDVKQFSFAAKTETETMDAGETASCLDRKSVV